MVHGPECGTAFADGGGGGGGTAWPSNYLCRRVVAVLSPCNLELDACVRACVRTRKRHAKNINTEVNYTSATAGAPAKVK